MKVVRIKIAIVHWGQGWCRNEDGARGKRREYWDKLQEPIIFLHHLIGGRISMKGLSDGAFDETQGRMDKMMEGKVKMGRST